MVLAGFLVFQLVIESSSQAGIEPALHGVVDIVAIVRRAAQLAATAAVLLGNLMVSPY